MKNRKNKHNLALPKEPYDPDEPASEVGMEGLSRTIGANDTGIPAIDAADEIVRRHQEEVRRLREATKAAMADRFIDPLTKCQNQAYFEYFIEHGFKAEQDDGRIGLFFFDLNDLKKVNDTEGHSAGDELIKKAGNYLVESFSQDNDNQRRIEAAGVLEGSFRRSDTVIRKGGDEFVVICYNDGLDGNFEHNLLDRIGQVIDESPVSFASGLAIYDREKDEGDIKNTVSRADAIMYEHKKAMKQQVS